MTGRWLAQEASYGACVVPLDDAVAHDNTGEGADEDCACGPSWAPVEQDDGDVRWVLTHHSLDGRESAEGPGV